MKSDKKQSIYKIVMLVALTALITFMITSIFMYKVMGEGNIRYVGVSTDTSSLSKTINYLKSFIEEHYIGEIDEEQMIQTAIKGYVAGLGDKYSEYISPDEMEEYMEDTIGKYVGIGVYITNNTQTNQIVILMPIEQSPAEEAGLKAGDVITKVDGVEYTGEQLDEASDKMKGEEGTKVTLTILRGEETFDVEVERVKDEITGKERTDHSPLTRPPSRRRAGGARRRGTGRRRAGRRRAVHPAPCCSPAAKPEEDRRRSSRRSRPGACRSSFPSWSGGTDRSDPAWCKRAENCRRGADAD